MTGSSRKFRVGDVVETIEPVIDVVDMFQKAKLLGYEDGYCKLRLYRPKHWQPKIVYVQSKNLHLVKRKKRRRKPKRD